MKRFLLIYLLGIASVFPQGSRPPVSTLNGLSDVTLTSPTDGQALIYNGGLTQWTNQAVPGGALSTLTDVTVVTPADNQLLKYSSASSKWLNYGPLAFTDITGNISTSQMASGSGASSTTYWRGDNTWASPPTGAVAASSNLLVGDGAGNAIDASFYNLSLAAANLLFQAQGNFTTRIQIANLDGFGSDTSVMASLQVLTNTFVRLDSLGPFFTTSGIFNANDGRLTSSAALDIAVGSGSVLKFSNDSGTTERVRFGSGVMVGAFVDKGAGTVNTSNGYYINGSKVGGGTIVTATVDQTATTETSHLAYTVPANTAVVGSTFRIQAWGTMDNGTTPVTFTPRVRWGGTGGVQLMATPTVLTSSSTSVNRDWQLDARVTVRTLGASGTAVAAQSLVNHIASAGGSYAADQASSGNSPITIDTTANKDVALTWTLSTSTGTPHVRTVGGTIELISP